MSVMSIALTMVSTACRPVVPPPNEYRVDGWKTGETLDYLARIHRTNGWRLQGRAVLDSRYNFTNAYIGEPPDEEHHWTVWYSNRAAWFWYNEYTNVDPKLGHYIYVVNADQLSIITKGDAVLISRVIQRMDEF